MKYPACHEKILGRSELLTHKSRDNEVIEEGEVCIYAQQGTADGETLG